MITREQRMHLVSMRIEQAELAIQRVESCLAHDQPELAANRIYYGMFYAMLALALLHGFETSKHQQIQGWFNKTFVNMGIFPKQFSKMVKDAFVARTDADYKLDASPVSADLEAMLADMKLFISTIKDYLKTQLQEE